MATQLHVDRKCSQELLLAWLPAQLTGNYSGDSTRQMEDGDKLSSGSANKGSPEERAQEREKRTRDSRGKRKDVTQIN